MLRVLDDESACRRALKYLCCDAVAADMAIDSANEPVVSEAVPVASRMSLKVLTWNIAGESTSRQAPSSLTSLDKLPLITHELLDRWLPDVFTLQECPSRESLPGLAGTFRLVGAENVATQGSFCLLYTSPSPRDRG